MRRGFNLDAFALIPLRQSIDLRALKGYTHVMRIVIQMIESEADDTCGKSVCMELFVDTTLHEMRKLSLAQVLWLSGKIPSVPLCSGLGMCGRCRVRFLSVAPDSVEAERHIFTEAELCDGWRLACRHGVLLFSEDIEIMIFTAKPCSAASPTSSLSLSSNIQRQEGASYDVHALSKADCVLAVDLGTTSIYWKLVSCAQATGDMHSVAQNHIKGDMQDSAHILAQGHCLNPQMGAGADVVSRLALAKDTEHAASLASLVHTALKDIMRELSQDVLSSPSSVREICLAANTAMTSIFLGKNIVSLAAAPYTLPMTGHSVEHVHGLPPVYIPPQLAPFVGGDVSAGVLSIFEQKPTFPFLLADLGTNGEFVLAMDERTAFVTSVPLGPAIEGIGLRFGAMAHGSGVVHTVRLTPRGLSPQTFDGASPIALCGTGYISLVHCLLRAGVLQEHGGFYKDVSKASLSPLGKKMMCTLYEYPDGQRLMLWPAVSNVFLRAHDVEEILKVKAAFSLAIEELLRAAHLSHDELAHMYIAGAMGSHVSTTDLEGLGFVPPGMGTRIRVVGNSALAGATLLACSSDARLRLHAWSKGSTLLQLAEDSAFEQKFLTHMKFSYMG